MVLGSSSTKDPKPEEVHGTKVLVCSLEPKFDELRRADSDTYSQFYPSTAVTGFHSVRDLLGGVRGYDVVHLLADVSPIGLITDGNGNQLVGTDLIEACCNWDVKLLWLASDNKPDRYVRGFKAVKPLNLVMTINRNGPGFVNFLRQLLSRMSRGEPMPVAWAALASQTPDDPRHAHLPATIFSAGRGGVKLQ